MAVVAMLRMHSHIGLVLRCVLGDQERNNNLVVVAGGSGAADCHPVRRCCVPAQPCAIEIRPVAGLWRQVCIIHVSNHFLLHIVEKSQK